MIEIDLEFMLDRVAAREEAKNCVFCHGRGKVVNPNNPNGDGRYSQDCPKCGIAYKLPRKWHLMSDEDILDLFPIKQSIDDKKAVLNQFLQVGLIDQVRYSNILKGLK